MRILTRANAHRPAVDCGGRVVGLEVASSPDTPERPERWSWHIRLLDASAPLPSEPGARTERHLVERGADQAHRLLEVLVDPSLVRVVVDVIGPDAPCRLERTETELLALVAASGQVDLEDRHRLHAGDAIVLTGDDPLSVQVRPLDGTLAVVRLRAHDNRPIGWVP